MMGGFFQRVGGCVAISLLAAIGVAHAGGLDQAVKFDIPAQSLSTALLLYSSQADIQVITKANEISAGKTAGVGGTMPAGTALKKLLDGTGLSYVVVGENTVEIASRSAGVGAAEIGETKAVRVAEAGAPSTVEQSATESSSGAEAGSSELKLEEIVVTAQKRAVAENIKDVPMTINAISGESLQKRGIGDVKELTFAIPSLSFHSYGGGTGFLNIRGIGGERGSSATVGVYLDEIPVEGGFLLSRTNAGLDLRTYDLERVEVLKGPQGTLFGESSLGGLIRYVTKDPKLDRVEGRVESTFFGTQDGDPSAQLVGVVNVPLVNDVLGLRIAGTYERNGGWIDQLADFNGPIMRRDINDNSLTDVRAKLLYVPTSALRVSALIDVHRNNIGAVNTVNVHPFEKSEFVQGVDRSYPTDGYDRFNLYNLTAQYDFGFATLHSSTSRFDSRTRSGDTQDPVTGLGAADQPEELGLREEALLRPSDEGAFARVTSQELRLTSNGAGPAKWLTGASWKKSRGLSGHAGAFGFLLPDIGFGTCCFGAGLSSKSSSEIVAGFTDGSYTFFDRLEIGGGVRVYHEKQDLKNFDANDVLTLDQSGAFNKTTYRVFAKYRLSDQVNLYANAATGFRSGVFNDAQAIPFGAPAETKPENSIFYEAGMKSTFFAKTVSLDLALFQGSYRDQLQGAVSPHLEAAWFDNAGTADIKGIEWQVGVVSPFSRLKFSLGGDVLKTEYTKVNPGNSVIVGDPMDFVPKYDLTFTTDYAFDWGSRVPGFVNVSYSRKGPMQNTNRQTGLGLYIDRTVPINLLQASLGATVNGFEFTVFARNILDERQALNPNGSAAYSQERPRTFGVSAARSF